ncbi:unnamed protein product [Didymodactylos carnosus]|uniref:Uncharacterized protein n=1 Tax=Didymodactylos carnosus TaxID=1234261 RepID=A0A814T820_9BILA|nr:unnamed protein product [Didymodactylos carnosus]CAF3918173.1 unnamed protein product [Didymodactylos carnosus]
MFTPRYDDPVFDPDVKFSMSMLDSDWKAHYIHPDYYKLLEPNATVEQPPKAALNFVDYMSEYQSKLRHHHDASTYTINITSNDVGKDYEVYDVNLV